MKSTTITGSMDLKQNRRFDRHAFFTMVIGLMLALCVVSPAGAQVTQGPKMFASPEAAVDAIVTAAETFDEAAFAEILGPGSYDIIHSGEPALDREVIMDFAKQARIKKTLTADKRNRHLVLVSVGEDNWPMPVPIVQKGKQWYFDAAAGRAEIVYRRVGRNELDAITVCRGFVEAQYEYAFLKRDGGGVTQYAQRIISTPGKQDGLAWKNDDGTWGGPVGENVAKVIAQGYSDKAAPYHGYFFRVLKGQGPAAPLGELDFVINGVMIGGFALIAFPSQYGVTGVKTFMVSNDGVVYQKDLGPDTLEIAKGIERFNPDKTWSPTFDEQ